MGKLTIPFDLKILNGTSAHLLSQMFAALPVGTRVLEFKSSSYRTTTEIIVEHGIFKDGSEVYAKFIRHAAFDFSKEKPEFIEVDTFDGFHDIKKCFHTSEDPRTEHEKRWDEQHKNGFCGNTFCRCHQ